MRRYRVYRSPEMSQVQTTVELPGHRALIDNYPLMGVESALHSQVTVLYESYMSMSALLRRIEVTMGQIMTHSSIGVRQDSPLSEFLKQRPHILSQPLDPRDPESGFPIDECSIDETITRLCHLFALLDV